MHKAGNIITLHYGHITANTVVGTSYKLGTLPSGYRPSVQIYFSGVGIGGNTIYSNPQFTINTNGELYMYVNVTVEGSLIIGFSTSFMV